MRRAVAGARTAELAVMKQIVTREMFSYWRRLKGARVSPEFHDVELSTIRHLLPYAFLIRFDAARGFPLEMCGTRTRALWLRDLNGRPFLDLWAARDGVMARAALEAIADSAKPIVVGAKHSDRELGELDLELLLLPLRYGGKTHARLLGCLAPAHQPDWIGRAAVRALTLCSMRVIDAAAAPAANAWRAEGVAHDRRLAVVDGGKALRLVQ